MAQKRSKAKSSDFPKLKERADASAPPSSEDRPWNKRYLRQSTLISQNSLGKQ